MIAKCECGKLATWRYMPGSDVACDECVPRGCSCNTVDPTGKDPAQYTDERGRLLPCCEWDEDPHGQDDHADWSDYPVWERLVIEEFGE